MSSHSGTLRIKGLKRLTKNLKRGARVTRAESGRENRNDVGGENDG